MKTKFDIAHDLLAVLGTIKDLELEVRKLKNINIASIKRIT